MAIVRSGQTKTQTAPAHPSAAHGSANTYPAVLSPHPGCHHSSAAPTQSPPGPSARCSIVSCQPSAPFRQQPAALSRSKLPLPEQFHGCNKLQDKDKNITTPCADHARAAATDGQGASISRGQGWLKVRPPPAHSLLAGNESLEDLCPHPEALRTHTCPRAGGHSQWGKARELTGLASPPSPHPHGGAALPPPPAFRGSPQHFNSLPAYQSREGMEVLGQLRRGSIPRV